MACCLWCEWAHCYITYSMQVKICCSNQNSQYLQHTQISALTTCQFAEMTVYTTVLFKQVLLIINCTEIMELTIFYDTLWNLEPRQPQALYYIHKEVLWCIILWVHHLPRSKTKICALLFNSKGTFYILSNYNMSTM